MSDTRQSSLWHLATQSGKFTACDMPTWMRAGVVCEHTTREAASNERNRLRRKGFAPYLVAGPCPHQVRK